MTDNDKQKLTEICAQEYGGNNCKISAGFVEGADPEVDIMYLRFEKDNTLPIEIHMRPDEAAAVSWVLTGTLWSNEMYRLDDQDNKKTTEGGEA